MFFFARGPANETYAMRPARLRDGRSEARMGTARSALRRQWRHGTHLLAAALAFGLCGIAEAHSLEVRNSTPMPDGTIEGRHAEYLIRFDRPVDHVTSRMEIVQSGRVVQSLVPL